MLTGSILQALSDAHQSKGDDAVGVAGPSETQPLNLGVYYKNTLVALCHALEDAILANDYEPLMITAFQQGKWYLQEAERYGAIAQNAPQIVIMAALDGGFADHPTSQHPNVALISLDNDDPVAQEWHLIILSPRYTAMVLCQELSVEDYGPEGVPEHDLARKFYGLWTFEPLLVLETVHLAIAHIQRYNPQLHQQLTAQVTAIASQMQQQDIRQQSLNADHLGDIVFRVVDYLQNCHQSPTGQAPIAARWPDLGDNLVSNELQAYLRVAQLIDQTDLKNPLAATEVAALAEAMGQLLDLPAWQLNRLRLAGLMHRIAYLQHQGESLSGGTSPRYGEDDTASPSCPLMPGTQLLRGMNRLKAIATILNHQTERWDGAGYPAQLAGDEIPLESRLLGLVAAFQQRVAVLGATMPEPEALSQALAQCREEAGIRWDPKLVETLSLIINGLQQGLSLSTSIPKIATGLWLLDSRGEEGLLGSRGDRTSLPTRS